MISTIITDRSQLWQEYDRASQHKQELTTYSSQFSVSRASSKDIPLYTPAGMPPDELAKSVEELKQCANTIKKCEADLEQYKADIAAVKKQFITIVIAVIVIIAITVFILLTR